MHRVFAFVVASFIATISLSAHAQVGASCPIDPSSNGDDQTRGFYVTNYQATTLNTVTEEAWASVAGTYTMSIVAHSGTYNGPVIGSASVTVALPGSGPSLTPFTYNFGGAPVALGSTIAFAQNISAGPGAQVFINTGLGPCPNVTETEGTTPPLDIFRRQSYGVTVSGNPVPVVPVPSLTWYGLALLALTLAIAAVFRLRRR
jgi:hypothetical protein